MRLMIAITAVAVLALVGCAPGAPGGPGGGQDPAPAPGSGSLVDPTLDELKAALIATGVECNAWVTGEYIELAVDEGFCDQAWVLSIYDSVEDRNAVIRSDDENERGRHHVAGAGWLLAMESDVGVAERDRVAAALGGTPLAPGDPIPGE